MKDLYELIKERNTLPLGNVYKKNINGGEYFYHQYSIKGIKKTKIIEQDRLLDLKQKIAKRKELNNEIKSLKEKYYSRSALSKSALNLSGCVMSRNKIVAKFINGNLIYLDEKLCPLIIKRTKRIEPFLKYRTIDTDRHNFEAIKQALNIRHDIPNELISLLSYSASITDDYWFKPNHSRVRYKNIRFKNDSLFNLSLKGR